MIEPCPSEWEFALLSLVWDTKSILFQPCTIAWENYPDLSSASDWLNQISHAARPIRSTTQIWVVTRNQYGISAFVSQTSFGRETSGSIIKCQLFSQASLAPTIWWTLILSFQHDLPSNLLPLIVFFGYTLQGTFDTSTNI